MGMGERTFPTGSVVKNLPANAGDVGLFPRSGRFPEKEIAPHSCILAWEIPWTEEPGNIQSQRFRYNLVTKQQQHGHGTKENYLNTLSK